LKQTAASGSPDGPGKAEQAVSVRVHLPALLVVGGFLMSINGGFVNVMAMLEPFHQGVSHLTGTLSRLGMELFSPTGFLGEGCGLVFSYVLGAALSATILESTSFKVGRRYGVMLVIEAVLLFFAARQIQDSQLAGLYLAALACGLQNALATQFSGAVIRTTHVTGAFTDLGIFLGKLASRKQVDFWRLPLYFILPGGFALGGGLAVLAFQHLGMKALYLASLFCLLLGLSYAVRQHYLLLRSRSNTHSSSS
jgi:uncharacterized membrane protein YoaK (UPF0700 family)